MRISLFFTALLLVLGSCSSSESALETFYEKYGQAENATTMTIPGWAIRLGAWVGKTQVDEAIASDALQFAGDVSKLEFLSSNNPIKGDDRKQLFAGLEEDQYEQLIQIRSDGKDINVYIKERDKLVRNLVVMIEDDSVFTLLNMKTKLELDQVANFVNNAVNDGEVNLTGI